ncbi:hypothetical protein [Salinibacter ruber]|uniref:hypothetical protein n=1 Tax=Salinibacter ruber TaxID=146919 RepID=UPI002166DE7E|nr:hypothetical protein [Salinibacter ruber]MCS4061036.1 Mg/Co/Ni transporter MgtE [Salinibacter ruber]
MYTDAMTIALIVVLGGIVAVLFFLVMIARLSTEEEKRAPRKRDEGILREVLTGFVVGIALPAIVFLSFFLFFAG